MKFFKDIVTDYDGQTYDTGRSLVVFIITSMTTMQGWAVWKGGSFDPGAYGAGVAAVVAALGFAILGDNAKRPTTGPGVVPKASDDFRAAKENL